MFVIETLHTRSSKVLKETAAPVSEHDFLTPEDKQTIIQRVHVLSPKTDGLPAAAVNKYKRCVQDETVTYVTVLVAKAWPCVFSAQSQIVNSFHSML